MENNYIMALHAGLSVIMSFVLNTLLHNCGLCNLYVYMFYNHILADIVGIIILMNFLIPFVICCSEGV